MLRKTREWMLGLAMMTTLATPWHVASAAGTETIVMVRHGEKPPKGLGQLDCQGLNRALALPPVITRLFGRPDAVFAPDPSQQKDDEGQPYDYVRPLATVLPTAIAAGLPVHTKFAMSDIAGLRGALEQPDYRSATILVAWEHHEIVALAQMLLDAHGGKATKARKWDGDDFDSIYVVRLTWTGDMAAASLSYGRQGLNGRPVGCPQ